MPGDDFTSWMIGGGSFPAMGFERARNLSKRRWTCPDEETIAAYVDGALQEDVNKQLENHLAKCGRCRSIVADVVKLQRDSDLPVPPFSAAKQAEAVPRQLPIGFRWIWVPAAAMAIVVLVAVMVIFRREPQKVAQLPASLPSPTAAKGQLGTLSNSVPEITRQPLLPGIMPVILSPLQDSTVKRDQLEFTWQPFKRSRYYDITVVTSDGDLLWEGKSEGSSLGFPRDIELKNGSYFVWITAYLTDGQIAKSSPVRFVVDR